MKLSQWLFSLADVRCEQCQKKFKLQDIKDNELLVCEACGHSKPIARRGDSPHIEFDPSLVRPTSAVNIERKGSILIIEKKWFSRHSKALLILAGVWNFTWTATFVAVKTAHLPSHIFNFGSVIHFLIVLFGLLMIYLALRQSLNRTRIMIKKSKMVVATSPLHWGQLAIYNVNEIQRMKLWKQHRKTGQLKFSFRVEMELKDGRIVTLCPAEDSNEAAYIEKTLEEFLTIERTPINVDPLVS